MAKQIGFNELFNKASFDQGVGELVKLLGKITEEIELAELAGRMLSETLGRKVKQEIASLSATSKTLSKDIADITAKMDQFKATTVQIDKVTEEYRKETERLKTELDKLKVSQEKVNTETSKTTNTTKQATVNFSALSQSLLGVGAGAAIVHRAITIFREQLTMAVESTIAFEKAMKEVQAINNLTDEQLRSLTQNANKLGSATEKTALEVAGLQAELGKLGFTTAEILASTSAIVNLSTATGENLAGSAMVAAATLRAFGLDATEMTRVVDVMTGSFVRSGLDLEKFRESMKLIAPIAKATGVDIESATAAISKLADAGLSGSLAGTATRNLLSSLSDPSEKLTQKLGKLNPTLADGVKTSEEFILALKELGDANISLAEANELVDVRAKTAFFILINQANAIEALTREYRSLTGEGQKIATMMRDTLANDIDVANSAFDALRRNLIEGNTPAMRETVQTITQLIEGLRLLSKGVIEFDGVIGIFLEHWKGVLNGLGDTWSLIFELTDSLFGASDAMMTIAQASKELRFKEMADEADSASKLFEQTFKLIELEPLVEEFEKLNNKVQKTSEDYEKLNELTIKLRMSFGMDAVAVDKLTKEYFINTEALKRNIESKRNEASITKETLENRLKEIEAEVIMNNLRLQNIDKISLFSERLKENSTVSQKNADLLREKNILLGALNNALVNNGWSVYTKAVKDANLAQEDAEEKLRKAKEAEEKAKAALDAKRKAFDETANNIKKVIDRQILETKLSEEATEIEKKFLQDRIDKTQEYIDKKQELADTQNGIAKTMSSLEKELLASDTEFAKQQFEILDKYNKDQVELEKEKWDKIQDYAQQAAEKLAQISRSIFDNRQIARENELNAIDVWEQERIRMAGDNDEAISAIEREAEERRRKIAIQQAKDNKKEAIFQIILSTAVAVMRTLEKGAGFFSTPQAIATAAFGAAQLAVVANRPLPEFAKGTNNSPEGLAIVGERGAELIVDGKTGKTRLSPDRPSITNLSKGSQVIPAHITHKLLTDPSFDYNGVAEKHLNKAQTIKVEKESIDYSRFGAEIRQAVKDIPVNQTNFDERGVTSYVIRRSVKVRRLNKRY